MRLGWGRDERSIFLLLPRTQRSTSAASRGPLYFAWGCFRDFLSKPCVHRRRGAMPGPGHEIVGASRLRDESIQLQHIMLYGGLLALPSAGFTRIRNWPLLLFSTSKAPVLRTRSLSLLWP